MWLCPQITEQWLESCSYLKKKLFAIFARTYSEQVIFLKTSFVGYITDTQTYSV